MNVIGRMLLCVFGITVAVTTSVMVMINGWGLEPRSWWWIIGATLVGHLIAQLIFTVAKNDK